MKAKITILVFFISLFSINTSIYSQNNPMITLEVDTENINENNIDEMATFGQPSETKNRDFTLEVEMGDVIIWQGRATQSSGGLVRIKLFRHDDGVKLLGTSRIAEQNDTGVVVGKVQAGNPGDIEKYTLKFEVRKRGSQTWTEYFIDPKLKLILSE
ncbi:hypothetical protein [Christiangramia sp. SM2212]|uniref:Uncharacterized protein n=1 Tax=Christiangramia sediminicola TaxID=3073267 RepID=A0ABU1ELI1_9FLAO|nr:hypothetical protein [Christiangramia sp. SM2212]MDR5589237.1 hypothetical protein [Christiangramia sp. SM2212]